MRLMKYWMTFNSGSHLDAAVKTAKDVNPVPVLQLGDQRLRKVCQNITNFNEPWMALENERLHLALQQFREENGFGRAISAPQIRCLFTDFWH